MRPAGAQADDAWDLVDAARAGDPAAFRLLYADNVAAVRSFLAARTADRALADDLTSETFLRAYTAIHRLSYRGRSFRGWLLTIARNLLLDDVRSARSRHETPLPEGYDATDAGVDPAAEACDRLASADLRRWVDSLPADQRRCVRLRFFEQRTVREVAAALRRSEGSVRALQLRAVRRLAGLLPPDIATA